VRLKTLAEERREWLANFEVASPTDMEVMLTPQIDSSQSIGKSDIATGGVRFTYSSLRNPPGAAEQQKMKLFRFFLFHHELVSHISHRLQEGAALRDSLENLLDYKNRQVLDAVIEVLSQNICGMKGEQWLHILGLAREYRYAPDKGWNINSIFRVLRSPIEALSNEFQQINKTSLFAQMNAPDVAERTLVSTQMEMAYPHELLGEVRRKLEEKQKDPGQVDSIVSLLAQSNSAGGLGALMPDLLRGWKDNGMDAICYMWIYRSLVHSPDGVDSVIHPEALEALLACLEDTGIEREFDLSKDWGIAEKIKVHYYSFTLDNGARIYYMLDNGFTSGRERKYIADELYPENLFEQARQMALYRLAYLTHLKHLKSQHQVKDKFILVGNEMYTALNVPDVCDDEFANDSDFVDPLVVHINHAPVNAAVKTFPKGHDLYLKWHIKPEYGQLIAKFGNISLAHLSAARADMIFGVSKKATRNLRLGLFKDYADKVYPREEDTDKYWTTNGVHPYSWQSPRLRYCIRKYMELAGVDNDDFSGFFAVLKQEAELKRDFIEELEEIFDHQLQELFDWLKQFNLEILPNPLLGVFRRLVNYKCAEALMMILEDPRLRALFIKAMVTLITGGRPFEKEVADRVKARSHGAKEKAQELRERVVHIPVYDYSVAPMLLRGLAAFIM
ncbi:MAG: hypothetical protein NT033_04360, partial [Candidatus Omnitrophica bacterium]|nr:hypothetical protein [Candidatus Omnitrophota bacterium]